MNEKRFSSVWDALCDIPEESANMRLRSVLMNVINERIKASGLTQSQVSERLNISQPRVSDLMRGKVDLFRLDMLVTLAGRLGLELDLRVRDTPAKVAEKSLVTP